MSRHPYLFWGEPGLRDYLEGRLHALKDAVNRVPEDHAWQADPEAWAKALAESHEVQTPELGEVWMDKPQEKEVDVAWDHFRRAIDDPSTPTYVPGYRVTFHIPFTGDSEVFKRRTSTFTTVLCDGLVKEHELLRTIEYPADSPKNLDAEASGWLGQVEKWLGWAASDTEGYRQRFQQEARALVEQRRTRIEKHREQLAEAKTPIGPPEERNKVNIAEAIVRRPSPVPKLVQASQATIQEPELEPALADEVLDHILEMIRETGVGMEKASKTYAKLSEEERRDFFVNNLNTHYRGQATAEAFNRSGHTDILVTHEGKNLFIGECKIWSGQRDFGGAVDQLFGYTAWRDTKTALIVFVGEKGFSEIIEKGRQALADHEQFVHWNDGGGESEFRATMTWPGDPEREIVLALTFFHLAT